MIELYLFQKQAIQDLAFKNKHIAILRPGAGKTAVSLNWAQIIQKRTGKQKLCVWTTASKRKSGDWERELELFTPDLSNSLSSLSVISWHKASEWVNSHAGYLSEYIYIFDELQKSKAGVSSGMGRAFLKVAGATGDWVGITATPGDEWISFYPYFQATGLVRNKTWFKRDYVNEINIGFPKIVGYRNEDKLQKMWASISTSPDTSQMDRELPSETHKVIEFGKPKQYDKIMKTRLSPEGELLDTSGALCAELRRQCFTKDKKQWVSDFVEGLGTRAVMFYNFTKTGDEMEEIITKALPKGAKVWRIDGKHHEIPTAETIGKYDVVLCQWQSGSEALNLQYINHWVSVEPHYSYSTSVQARGRIKRIGQDRPMFYWYLKTPKTIEDAVYEALSNKSTFAEDVWCIDNNLIEGE